MNSEIKKYFKKSPLLNKVNPCLSSKSKSFIKNIQNQLKKARSKPPAHSLEHIINKDIDTIKRDTMYRHMPHQIKSYIESTKAIIQNKYTFVLGNRKIRVFLFGYHKWNLNQCLERIKTWLSVVSLYSRKICAQDLSIYLYLTPLKKQIADIGEPMNEIHANTAFTTSCSSANSIFIYREEEWFKVFIHETFHCFGLDFSEIDAGPSNRQIQTLFPGLDKKVDVRLYETYCEMWAEIIAVLFSDIPRGIHTTAKGCNRLRHTIKPMSTNIVSMLRTEQAFSLFQCKKVLEQQEHDYMDLLNKSAVYQETTQIFSYFVLKSILMFHLNEFIEWCIERNHQSLDFVKTKDNIHEYGLFVERFHRDADYIGLLDQIDVIHSPEFVRNTLRMSVYG